MKNILILFLGMLSLPGIVVCSQKTDPIRQSTLDQFNSKWFQLLDSEYEKKVNQIHKERNYTVNINLAQLAGLRCTIAELKKEEKALALEERRLALEESGLINFISRMIGRQTYVQPRRKIKKEISDLLGKKSDLLDQEENIVSQNSSQLLRARKAYYFAERDFLQEHRARVKEAKKELEKNGTFEGRELGRKEKAITLEHFEKQLVSLTEECELFGRSYDTETNVIRDRNGVTTSCVNKFTSNYTAFSRSFFGKRCFDHVELYRDISNE